MYISEIRTKAPADERMPLERKFYDTLEKLKIPYEQVDNDPASSMEECAEVDKAIGTEIRKNVFLCNQKKTTFFLLVMPADKAFDTSWHDPVIWHGFLFFLLQPGPEAGS